jgi:hypothetical protein
VCGVFVEGSFVVVTSNPRVMVEEGVARQKELRKFLRETLLTPADGLVWLGALISEAITCATIVDGFIAGEDVPERRGAVLKDIQDVIHKHFPNLPRSHVDKPNSLRGFPDGQ